MKYSLIIPAYNAEATIAACIESALRQSISKEDYEVIVVDDGSLDKTPKIAKNYAVKLIMQKNQGPAVARNRAAQEARGDILVFVDADCELDLSFIKNIIAPIEQNRDIVGVQGSYKTRQKEFIARFAQIEIETRYKSMIKNEYIDFIGTYAAAYRRDIFLKYGGFDTKFPLAAGEDTDFSYKLHQKGNKMVFKPEAFIYHRHPARLKEYMKSKFYKSFWRVKVYKNTPKKVFKDSYTVQSLKFEVFSIILFALFGFLSIFSKLWLVPIFAIFVYFLLQSIHFFRLLGEKKYPMLLVIMVMLFSRAVVSFFGLACGAINELRTNKVVL